MPRSPTSTRVCDPGHGRYGRAGHESSVSDQQCTSLAGLVLRHPERRAWPQSPSSRRQCAKVIGPCRLPERKANAYSEVMYRLDTSPCTGPTETGRYTPMASSRRSGVLEFAILGLLRDAPMHGYELRKRLNAVLGSFRAISYGSLYPASADPRRAGPDHRGRGGGRQRARALGEAGEDRLRADRRRQGPVRRAGEAHRPGVVGGRGVRRPSGLLRQHAGGGPDADPGGAPQPHGGAPEQSAGVYGPQPRAHRHLHAWPCSGMASRGSSERSAGSAS